MILPPQPEVTLAGELDPELGGLGPTHLQISVEEALHILRIKPARIGLQRPRGGQISLSFLQSADLKIQALPQGVDRQSA